MSDDRFGVVESSLDTPLIVVTAAEGREQAGCLVSFHSQCSIDPLRYCVWLSKANYTYRVALYASHLGVHFLTTSDLPLAERFGALTGDTADKFAEVATAPGPGGVPVLTGCPHRLVGRRITLVDDGGDHVCMIIEPVEVHAGGPFRPLPLSAATHIHAGHGYRERPAPPTERAAHGPGR
jgi:flavin reductase (DIM6/NTAB) family NADH-FMN oxidoreductase RutF